MKQVHSTNWKSSVQPRKQRKYVYNLPDHLRGEQLNVHLSKPLREKHGTRAVRVRKGDKVKVLRGTHKGKEGKVERVDMDNCRVIVEKIESKKLSGGAAPYPLRPSNLLITELTSEKRRFKRAKAATLEKK
jgi:large subunit ribosomal protein L24